jgi:hypothetical protein
MQEASEDVTNILKELAKDLKWAKVYLKMS